MRKKRASVKKSPAKRTTRRTITRDKEHILLLPFSFRRIILVSTCLLLFVVVVATHKNQVTQSVAGITIARGLFAQATVDLPSIKDAVAYNVYYKKESADDYTNAARSIPAESKTYTISYLKKGETYTYKISAVDANGTEFWWSDPLTLTNLQSM